MLCLSSGVGRRCSLTLMMSSVCIAFHQVALKVNPLTGGSQAASRDVLFEFGSPDYLLQESESMLNVRESQERRTGRRGRKQKSKSEAKQSNLSTQM